jgi:hypothetical protein
MGMLDISTYNAGEEWRYYIAVSTPWKRRI